MATNEYIVKLNPEQMDYLNKEFTAKIEELREQLATAHLVIGNARNLLRTGLPVMGYISAPESWEAHKCNRVAGELQRLLDTLNEEKG